MGSAYTGSTWRSRFLRAPKMALLIESTEGFVRLGELAALRLGLKTGADKFFLVARLDSHGEQHESRGGNRIHVSGLDKWEGSIPAKDMMPALLNPHALQTPVGRQFVVPKRTKHMYLYPRVRSSDEGLTGYVRWAERRDIHRRPLVLDNASENRWYRQVRRLVCSPWALPYNSAYDYGAWDNRVTKAVLNGRFVGVEPLDGVDEELLGAALNSTFPMMTRLLEATATGVEGALDVGPPAAKRLIVPDIRALSAAHQAEVRGVLARIRHRDVMLPAPTRSGHVDPLRQDLDLALLEGLGYSRGDASIFLSRMYRSYARWRAAVEDVEQQMRKYRADMSRHGVTRTEKPTELAARRIWDELEAGVRVYPSECLSIDDGLERVEVPRRFQLPLQEPLMDPGAIRGSGGTVVDLGSFARVRYAKLLLTIGFQPPLEIPMDSEAAGRIADTFEKELARVATLAKDKASAYVGDAAQQNAVVAAVKRYWFRKCQDAGMSHRSAETSS